MLLDVSMPGLDGLEALPQVLAASPALAWSCTPASRSRGSSSKARQLGAAAFIEKSAPIDHLIDRLLAVVGAEAVRTRRGPTGGAATEPGLPATSAVDQRILDEHLERFREVFEEAAIGMATMTLTGHLVRTNRALAALVQRTRRGPRSAAFYGELTQGREEAVQAALEDIIRRPLDVVQLEHGLTGGHRRSPAPGDVRAGPGLPRPAPLPVPAGPGRHCRTGGRGGAAPERGTVPAAGRGGGGLRDLHARPDRAHRQLERRSAAQQGLHAPRRSSASTSGSSTLPRSRRDSTPSTSSGGPARRTLRGGGLAHPQGRFPVLGQRADHRGVQRSRRAHRVRQGHPRHHRAAASAGGA